MEEESDLTAPVDFDPQWTDGEPKRTSKKWIDKKIKWKDEEILTVLELIQKYNLLDRNPTDLQLGETLSQPLNDLGFERTPHQIHLKMKALRRSYVKCKKARCTLESLRECPFYDLLDEIYGNKNLLIEDTRDKVLQESYNENSDTEDVWTKVELETMLILIKDMKMYNQITLRNFSPRALQKISAALDENGYNRSPTEVKTALQSLKTTFLNFKKNYQRGQSTNDCPYYSYLKKMWEQEYVKLPKIPRQWNKLKIDEIWSEEETVMLLTSIKDLNISREAFQNTDLAAEKLLSLLNDSGYTRTKEQIQNKMENLMQNYIEGKRCEDEAEAVRKFPFFFIYQEIFGSYFKNLDLKSFGQTELEEEQLKKNSRGPCWHDKETKTLLDLIVELNLSQAFRERMTMGVLQKLINPMKKEGYIRTPIQIKIKIKNLRMHYLRCIDDGCTPEALADCPFYNELNKIYNQSKVIYVSPSESRIIVRSRGNSSTKSKTDDPILNDVKAEKQKVTKIKKQIIKTRSILLKNINKEDKTTWEPIETIREVNGIKLNNEKEDEQFEELEQEEERDIEELDPQEGENIEEVMFVKEERKGNEDTDVVIEDVNYTDYVENYNFQELHEFDSNLEVADDHTFEKLSKHSPESLQEMKDNLMFEFLRPKVSILKESEVYPRPSTKVTEKFGGINIKKLPIVTLEKGNIKVVGNRPVKNLQISPLIIEKSPEKEKPFKEVISQPASRKRKISDIISGDLEEDVLEDSEKGSISTLVSSIIEHEKQLQKDHQEWLEQQFKVQREHDNEQRNVLLNELKEFRQAVTTFINKENATR